MEKDSLLQRMQDYLGRHPAVERRTIFLDGKAVAANLCGAFEQRLPGTPWYEDRFQRGMVDDDHGPSLVVLATMETLDSDRRGAVHITMTIHGIEDTTFAATRDDWWSWWASQVDSPQLAVA
jgi:hypothetical protein